MVKPADDEVFNDEAEDEFAKFFSNEQVCCFFIEDARAGGGEVCTGFNICFFLHIL